MPFIFYPIGLGALSFLANLGGALAWIINLAIKPNINTLVVLNSRSFGLDPSALSRTLDLATLPSPLQAALVIGVWSALLFFYAYGALVRRDVTGAA